MRHGLPDTLCEGVNKAIDKGDYEAVVKALNEGGDDIAKAVDS